MNLRNFVTVIWVNGSIDMINLLIYYMFTFIESSMVSFVSKSGYQYLRA